MGNDAILALRDDVEDSSVVILNNLSRQRHTITLDLTGEEIAMATDLLGDRRYEPVNPKRRQMRMDGFGYRWLRLGGVS